MAKQNDVIANDERIAERVYREWDEALGRKDLQAAMQLYAPDATLESPLICHLLGSQTGALEGRQDLARFVEFVFERTPALRQRYRKRFFTDGTTLMWEYPRLTPDGEQMDLVEVMELKNGLIQHHRVYWGWRGVKILEQDKYRPG